MKNYFKLEELLRSNTAVNKKIENLPSFEVIDNLIELRDNLLNPLREAWGSAIHVNSGFRCPALNKAVGGVTNSQHQYGCAVDIVPSNGKFTDFVNFLKKWLPGRDWDKCIIETSKSSGHQWIHIVWKSSQGYQRHKLFSLDAN